MKDKTIDEMIQAFLKNGLDMTYFKFINDHDKENFFIMYTDLLQSMVKGDEECIIELTEEKNLHVTLESEEIYFYISEDYETLMCDLNDSHYDKENGNQMLILTILFLTIKELKAMIDMFANEIIENMKDRKSGKLTRLPESFVGKANYLSSKQESIMDDIKKAREKVIIKEIK